jgi:hypothetical protein
LTIIQFADKHSCKVDFKQKREKGVVCKKDGCTKHYWLQDKWQRQCSVLNFKPLSKAVGRWVNILKINIKNQ